MTKDTLSLIIAVGDQEYAVEIDVEYDIHLSGPDEGKPAGTREMVDMDVNAVTFERCGDESDTMIQLVEALALEWLEDCGRFLRDGIRSRRRRYTNDGMERVSCSPEKGAGKTGP